nr:AAA family ATPase [Lentilactobacillus otakiensis]
MNNRVFVITGAAGSGKTTVRDYLHDQYKMARVITHTTRAPRAYERDGVDYYFEDDKSFFLTTIFWNRFTMPAITMVHRMKAWKNAWEKSPFATIVLDTAGAITYKEKLGDKAVIIFLQVGDTEELQRRMQGRGDNADMVAKRVNSKEYNRDLQMPYELEGKAYKVINHDWQQTRAQIDQIVEKYRNEPAG